MKDLSNFVAAATEGIQEGNTVLAAIFSLANYGSYLPTWWSPARDKKMREEWRDGTILSGLMYAAVTKLANMPIRVVPRDPNIAAHNRLADELTEQFSALSEFGSGMGAAITAFAEDYLATDNGGFLEVVGPGDKKEPLSSVPMGVRHLDSLHCTRMSDPLLPVVYVDGGGKKHTYHHTRILSMSQLAASRRDMNGVGFCSVSRSIEVAVRFQDANRYVRSKMGGTSAKKLLVGKNITGKEIIKSMTAATALVNEIGGIDTDTIAIGGQDIEITPIDIHHFPEFDEEAQLRTIMTVLALAWGLEFNEVMAVATGRASDEVALQRSRGRLQTMFANQFGALATYKLVPPSLKVEIDYSDDFLDQQREVIADIRARNLERMVKMKVLTPLSARRRLAADGYISETDYLDMCLADGFLPDGTSVERVFFDQDYAGLLAVPLELLLGEADPAQARRQIAANRHAVQALYPLTTSSARHSAYKTAVAALNWLEKKYTPQPQVKDPAVEAPPGEQKKPEPQAGQSAEQTKAADSIEDLMDEAAAGIYLALDTADHDDAQKKLAAALLAAYLLASGLDSPDEDGRQAISNELALFEDAWAGIVTRYEAGTDMQATADRMAAQAGRLYWQTYMEFAAEDGPDHVWELGATEQHCEDCLRYSQAGPQPIGYWKEAYNRGHYPQSPMLTCHGYYCDCQLRAV